MQPLPEALEKEAAIGVESATSSSKDVKFIWIPFKRSITSDQGNDGDNYLEEHGFCSSFCGSYLLLGSLDVQYCAIENTERRLEINARANEDEHF